MGGFVNVLEVVCELNCKFFMLSFIGVFGLLMLKDNIL